MARCGMPALPMYVHLGSEHYQEEQN
jgi:hypothetical protein